MPEAMRNINWIDFKATSFDEAFPELIQAIEIDREHARTHTVLQRRAVEWTENDRSQDFCSTKPPVSEVKHGLRKILQRGENPFTDEVLKELRGE